MNRALIAVLVVAGTLGLEGCAGTDFKRPDPSSLTLGRSKSSDIVSVMGQPRQVSEGIVNERKIKSFHYAYAESTGKPRHAGVTPARAIVFTTSEDNLVAQEFVSSFDEDATDFDDSRVASIVKGKSTKSDVARLLGKPSGEALYPIIKRGGERAYVYSYSHIKGSLFSIKRYQKALIVSFGPDDIVTDVEFSSIGEK